MSIPLQALQELEAAVRAMKRQLIDDAVAEGGGKPLTGTYLANGQPNAAALGGMVPLSALPPIPPPLPFLANWSMDIPTTLSWLAAVLQFEDDFDDDALDPAWVNTTAGAATYVSETDFHGYLWLEQFPATERGKYRVVTPQTDMTFLAKIHYSVPATDAYVGFVLTDSSDTPIATATIQRDTAGVKARTGASGGTTVALPGFYFSDTIYLLMFKNGTNYQLLASRHGFYPWETVAVWTEAGTVARFQLIANGDGGTPNDAVAFVDFVRVYDTSSSVIGGLP